MMSVKKQQMILLQFYLVILNYIHHNNFQTAGAIKITKALQNTSSLAKYDISNNDIEERAINGLKDIFSWNTKLNLPI